MTSIPCTKCGTEILGVTAKINGGLCGPCKRGAGFCVVCGKRVWQANASGEYIHVGCMLKRNEASVVQSSGISWNVLEEIDWDMLQTGVFLATRNAFQRVAITNPNRGVQNVTLAYRIDEGLRVCY